MRPQLSQKWRPTLGLVLGGGLAGTLILSLIGLVSLRYMGPEIGFKNAAALISLLILFATAFLGWLLVRLLVTPIRALENYAAEMRAFARQDIDPPKHSGTTELYGMAQSVIDMADHLRNRELTIRSFTDHVSHEIKTPVSAIRAASELLADGNCLNASDQNLVAEIEGATQQIERQLHALRDVARAREIRHIGQCSLSVISDWVSSEFPTLSVTLKGAEIIIPLGQEGLIILLSHLAQNASNHRAQNLDILAYRTTTSVELCVCDDGVGISDGNSNRIFDPFFTTRREQGGTGMGLTILRNMLSVHNADIALRPSDIGACFVVRFSAYHALS